PASREAAGVTHVSGTRCHPCLRPLNPKQGLVEKQEFQPAADEMCDSCSAAADGCSVATSSPDSAMPARPSRREIAEQDRYMLTRLAAFRRAADAVTGALAAFPDVQAVTLFGSTARPLAREVPRFQPFRRFGIEIFHECKDVDLAVALDRLDNLSALNRARN